MSDGIAGLSSMATRALLAALARSYEAGTGRVVAVRSLGGVEAARLVRAGEAVDVIVLASGVMEALEGEGHVRQGSRADVVRSQVALAVPEGAARPGIATEAEVREAILAAPRVCYSTGPSGDQLKGLLRRWSLVERLAGRLVQAPAGVPVGRVLAEGGAGIGVQQLSELVGVPGITVVGTLPPSLGTSTVFTAGIGAKARAVESAQAFVGYLASSAAKDAKKQAGFDLMP